MQIIMTTARWMLDTDPALFCVLVGFAVIVVFLWCIHQIEKRDWFHLT